MCAALGGVEPELVGFPGMALARDARKMLRFVVHAAGWLYTMVLYGGRCCCYMQMIRNIIGNRAIDGLVTCISKNIINQRDKVILLFNLVWIRI